MQKNYTAPGAIARMPGETFAAFDARQRAHRAANTVPVKRKRVARKKTVETYETRGDDIGLSPDV
jgi:hypothetical protein